MSIDLINNQRILVLGMPKSGKSTLITGGYQKLFNTDAQPTNARNEYTFTTDCGDRIFSFCVKKHQYDNQDLFPFGLHNTYDKIVIVVDASKSYAEQMKFFIPLLKEYKRESGNHQLDNLVLVSTKNDVENKQINKFQLESFQKELAQMSSPILIDPPEAQDPI